MITVFVYGTLLEHESNYGIVAPFVLSRTDGTVRGRLVDFGPYPALVRVDDSRCLDIRGEWIEVTEEGLRAMDELEGYVGPGSDNDYERVWVRDSRTDREGWAYIWTDSRGCPEISGDSWREYRGNRRNGDEFRA